MHINTSVLLINISKLWIPLDLLQREKGIYLPYKRVNVVYFRKILIFMNFFVSMNRDVKNATVGSPVAPVSSVSVISYEGTLVSELKQTTPLRTKLSSALPNRPKGPARASSTSSLDRISEEKKTGSESIKQCFISGIGWVSQVSELV